MRPHKIDKDELYQMLAEGKSVTECAKHFGVTSPAITKQKKQLGQIVAQDIQLASAHRFVDEHLNTVAQLQQINNDAHRLLRLCMRWIEGDETAIPVIETEVGKQDSDEEGAVAQPIIKDPAKLALAAMKRIESQLRLQNETLALLTNMKAVHEFQQDVIRILKEVVPSEVADEFCRRWDKSRTIPRLLRSDKPRA